MISDQSASAASRDGGATGPKAQTELCCRGLVGKDPARTPGNEGQASSVFAPVGGEPAETKKARSVVALSRVPRGERGAPVSPPAAGQVFGAANDRRRYRLGDLTPGGCPASCPDAPRPTH